MGFGTKDTLRVTAVKQRAEELVSGNQNSWIFREDISMETQILESGPTAVVSVLWLH